MNDLFRLGHWSAWLRQMELGEETEVEVEEDQLRSIRVVISKLARQGEYLYSTSTRIEGKKRTLCIKRIELSEWLLQPRRWTLR